MRKGEDKAQEVAADGIRIGGRTFRSWEDARSAARSLLAVQRDGGMLEPRDAALVVAVAAHFPAPPPEPAELDRRISRMARGLRPVPWIVAEVLASPFDEAIEQAEALLAERETAWLTAKATFHDVEARLTRASFAKEGSALALERESLAEQRARAKEELTAADHAWTRVKCRIIALDRQRSFWRHAQD